MDMLGEFVQTADWKNEKHVPVLECPDAVKADTHFDLTVTIGKAVSHPNTTEHHIAWIAVHFLPKDTRRSFEIGRFEFSAHGQSVEGPNQGPVHTGSAITTSVKLQTPGTLFATCYCNIHGLWEAAKPVELA